MTATHIIFLVALGAFMLPVYQRWLLARTAPLRDELLSLGTSLLNSSKYNEKQKHFICDMLDDAMDWKFMVWAALYLPKVVASRLFGGMQSSSDLKELMRDADFMRFAELHMNCTQAANPAFAALFRFEVSLLTLLVNVLIVPLLVAETVVRSTPHTHGNEDGCGQTL